MRRWLARDQIRRVARARVELVQQPLDFRRDVGSRPSSAPAWRAAPRTRRRRRSSTPQVVQELDDLRARGADVALERLDGGRHLRVHHLAYVHQPLAEAQERRRSPRSPHPPAARGGASGTTPAHRAARPWRRTRTCRPRTRRRRRRGGERGGVEPRGRWGGGTEGSVATSPAIPASGTSSPGRRSNGEGVPGATAAPGSLAEPRRSSAEDDIARTSPDGTGGDVRPPRARRDLARGRVRSSSNRGPRMKKNASVITSSPRERTGRRKRARGETAHGARTSARGYARYGRLTIVIHDAAPSCPRQNNANKDESRVVRLTESESSGLDRPFASDTDRADPAPSRRALRTRRDAELRRRFGGGDAIASGTHHSDTEGGGGGVCASSGIKADVHSPCADPAARGPPRAFSAADAARLLSAGAPRAAPGAATENSTRRNRTPRRARTRSSGAPPSARRAGKWPRRRPRPPATSRTTPGGGQDVFLLARRNRRRARRRWIDLPAPAQAGADGVDGFARL